MLVSNRGHNSIAVFAIRAATTCGETGYLRIVNYCHTKGRTPRHFQFDPSGQYLLSANQDTDSVTVFRQAAVAAGGKKLLVYFYVGFFLFHDHERGWTYHTCCISEEIRPVNCSNFFCELG